MGSSPRAGAAPHHQNNRNTSYSKNSSGRSSSFAAPPGQLPPRQPLVPNLFEKGGVLGATRLSPNLRPGGEPEPGCRPRRTPERSSLSGTPNTGQATPPRPAPEPGEGTNPEAQPGRRAPGAVPPGVLSRRPSRRRGKVPPALPRVRNQRGLRSGFSLEPGPQQEMKTVPIPLPCPMSRTGFDVVFLENNIYF